MSLDEYGKEKLWPILVETVHALVMYPNHKAYTRDTILGAKPDVTPQELASRLGITVGEAVVILFELISEKKTLS